MINNSVNYCFHMFLIIQQIIIYLQAVLNDFNIIFLQESNKDYTLTSQAMMCVTVVLVLHQVPRYNQVSARLQARMAINHAIPICMQVTLFMRTNS